MREVEDLLRNLIRSAGLDWLLDELDSAIATGVAEEKLLQRRRGTSTEEYEALAVAEVGTDTFHRSLKRGASVVVTTRPMNARERTELHLNALRRLILEVPEIEVETLKIVSAEGDRHRAPVRSVRFVPDEELTGHRDQTHEVAARLPEDTRARLQNLFREAREEISR
ncbi:hypothetical protein [Streptomyces noursei]|uniref:hypothetical protein n=1 Tax=Streptomyces noursei TaxID=1971 RepID=UPI0019627884|nr:hypothetical protein [Streptomyces noursei]QRX92337.1 hypothetical protein JNO44_17030 [Streptomyces noursei]